MNFKKTAIALAMAGVVATPMAAQADLYASARIGIENVDTGGVSDLRVRSLGSRFGVKSETDLGNGLTGFGKYEWDVDFSEYGDSVSPSEQDSIQLRHRYVGVKGDFGSVLVGQTYQTYYNFITGKTDNPWWGSGYYYNTTSRQGNGITYAGSAGDVSFGVTMFLEREAEEDAVDRTEAAINIGFGDMTFGLGVIAYQDEADDAATLNQDESDTRVGVVLAGIPLGDIASLNVGIQSQDEISQYVIEALIGNGYIHYEMQDSGDSSDSDPTALTLGYTQSLGRKTTMYYEFVGTDADTDESDDDLTIVRAVLKYDIE